jgi:hypothetical protein
MTVYLRCMISCSGGDDLLWAVLALTQLSDLFDSDYRWSGARGAKQLYAEAEHHFVYHDDIDNSTRLFWDTNRDYTATISITLWITASVALFQRDGNVNHLQNALSGFDALVTRTKSGAVLITDSGHVYDGHNDQGLIDSQEWTYNSGVAIAALTALYRATRREHFFTLAACVAQTGCTFFWSTGHLAEQGRTQLNRDQMLFKGLFLHYLRDFLHLFYVVHKRPIPEWVGRLKTRLTDECEWLVHNRLRERGFCAYWGETEANLTCEYADSYIAQSMATASQLFAATALMQQLTVTSNQQ